MFGRKRRLVSEAFGEMILCGSKWSSKWMATTRIPLTLWSKTYYITSTADAKNYMANSIVVASSRKRDGIGERQEKAYCEFKENIIENQKRFEKKIEEYYKTSDTQVLISKVMPTELRFCRNSEIGLYVDTVEPSDSPAAIFWMW